MIRSLEGGGKHKHRDVKCSFDYQGKNSSNLCDGVYCITDSNCESNYCSKDNECSESPLIFWLVVSGVAVFIVLIIVCIVYYCRRSKKNGGCFKKEKRKGSPGKE